MQGRKWTCGPASVKNALMAFGTNISEAKIRKYANTTPREGTDEFGIINAIRQCGFSATEHRFNKKNEAWNWLRECLQSGKVVILCFDNWDHWVTALGQGAKNGIIIFDSANYVYNIKENGCYVLSKKELLNRWWNTRNDMEIENSERIYAISVGKK